MRRESFTKVFSWVCWSIGFLILCCDGPTLGYSLWAWDARLGINSGSWPLQQYGIAFAFLIPSIVLRVIYSSLSVGKDVLGSVSVSIVVASIVSIEKDIAPLVTLPSQSNLTVNWLPVILIAGLFRLGFVAFRISRPNGSPSS